MNMLIAIDPGDLRSLRRECCGDGPPNAIGRPKYYRDVTLEPQIHSEELALGDVFFETCVLGVQILPTSLPVELVDLLAADLASFDAAVGELLAVGIHVH